QHEATVMNITWRLSFTGRTSAELVVDELAGPILEEEWAKPNTDDQEIQYTVLSNGLVGHRHSPDLHPRRKLFLITTRDFIHVVELSLIAIYWISQTSIEHISLQGTYLLAIYYIMMASTRVELNRGFVHWILYKGSAAIAGAY
ncbi:hypothetical protein WG66_000065, partial [Moniliophthora roreri]